MAAKCPACGFESAEGAQWCEFCKEPFNKKKAAPAAPAAPTAAAAPAAMSFEDLPPELREKLTMTLKPGQDGETVPEAPKWLKPVALGFVALIALVSVIFSMIFVVKTRAPR